MERIEEYAPTAALVAEKQDEFLAVNARVMQDADVLDKRVEKEKKREIKLARKIKEKAIRREESGYQGGGGTVAALAENEGDEGEESLISGGDGAEMEEEDDTFGSASGSDSENESTDARASKRLKLESMEDMAMQLMNQ